MWISIRSPPSFQIIFNDPGISAQLMNMYSAATGSEWLAGEGGAVDVEICEICILL
jgi:hypothetical protein